MKRMRILAALWLALTFAVQAAAPLPRPAPALEVLEPSGKKLNLASLKGKVVVVQFLLTTCPHCQAFSRTLNQLLPQYGPNVVAVGVAFDKDDAKNVSKYIQTVSATFPVGSVELNQAMGFLGYSVMDYNRLRVPQVAVVDKKGVLRAQTVVSGEGAVGTESGLRALLNTLVKE
jgi:thiol-disulfide isomerase/thioredoxin